MNNPAIDNLAQRRAEFEHRTWKMANKQKPSNWPVLYDAGELGFCVLTWSHGKWSNRWFDKAEKLDDL